MSINSKSKIYSIAPRIPPGRAMSNGLAAINYGLRDISYGLWAMDYGLWAIGHGRWSMGYGLCAMDHGLWSMGYGLWTMGCGLICIFIFAPWVSSLKIIRNPFAIKKLAKIKRESSLWQPNIHRKISNNMKSIQHYVKVLRKYIMVGKKCKI